MNPDVKSKWQQEERSGIPPEVGRMDPEIKAKWVAALRSGEFEQGSGALCRGGRYCCLGVLCELAYREGVVARKGCSIFPLTEISPYPSQSPYRRGHTPSPRCSTSEISYDGNESFLPLSVQTWAGLDTDNPEVPALGTTVSLDNLNDSGKTFQEIAEIIEENL